MTLPRRRVVVARHQLDHRRLAGTGLTDERNRLAGHDAHVDTAQRFVDRVQVAEPHVLEPDLTLQNRNRNGFGGRGHRRGRVEQLGDARDRDLRLLVRVEHLRQLLNRREEQVEIQQERDDVGHGHRPVRHEHAADTQHDDARDVGEEVDEREVDRDESLRVDAGIAVSGGHGLEILLVALLAHERLRHAHARQSLLQVGVDGRDVLACRFVRTRRLMTEPQRGDDQGRQHHAGYDGEARVDEHERDADTDERDEVDERVHQAVLEQLRQRVDVGRHAGHDPTRHLVLVVVDAESLQVREHLDAQGVQ